MKLLHIEIVPSIMIMTDNQITTRTMKNEIISTAANYISLQYHFIKEEISKGLVSVEWHSSKYQLADILTRPFLAQRTKCYKTTFTC